MGSIRTVEQIAKLVKTSVTTLSLPASRVNIGAAQYVTAALTLNTAVTGVGGVDVAISAGQLYYLYAVVSSGTVYLIAFLNSSLPSPFTQARAVGGFTTNASSQIDQVGEYPGNLAVAGSVSAGGGVAAQDTRNYIINGAMDFAQRIGSGNQTVSNTWGVDRWLLAHNHSTVQVSRQDASFAVPGTRYCVRMANVTTGAGTYFFLCQSLELANITAFVGKTVTISAYIRRSAGHTGAIRFTALYSTNNEDGAYTLLTGSGTPLGDTIIANSSLSTTFTRFSITVAVPSTARSFAVCFAESGVINEGQYVEITGVMLNIGTQPAPFQRAGGTIGGELLLAQRYYETSSYQDVAISASNCQSSAYAGAASRIHVKYSVEKRAVPAITTKSDAAVTTGTSNMAYTVNGTNNYADGSVAYTIPSSFTLATPSASNSSFTRLGWIADAEL